MSKKLKIVACTLAVALCVGCFAGCTSSKEEAAKAELSNVRSVCELATLQCYYHNVAKGETEAWDFLKEFLKLGYKKVWTEYDGVVTVGIDASEVTVSQPDDNGVVQVHIPEAQILGVTIDTDSISDTITDQGLFETITTEEKTLAFAEAQSAMQEAAEENNSLLSQAYDRAQRVIENYIINVGKEVGEDYTVQWV